MQTADLKVRCNNVGENTLQGIKFYSNGSYYHPKTLLSFAINPNLMFYSRFKSNWIPSQCFPGHFSSQAQNNCFLFFLSFSPPSLLSSLNCNLGFIVIAGKNYFLF